MKELTPDDLSGEEEFEMKAAFGADAVENGNIVRLEQEDLQSPAETSYPMARQLDVGDHVVIGSERHDKTISAGVIAEMTSYSMTLDLDADQSGSRYFGFDGFGGDRGLLQTIDSRNGTDVDIEYGEVEVEGEGEGEV